MIKKHLFLDLEETIITPVTLGWYNVQLKNAQKIKCFMEEFKPDFLHVFSFAIWDHFQLGQFNDAVRPRIEKILGMQFSDVPTIDFEIIPACSRIMNISAECVTFSDVVEFWGKQESFRLYVRDKLKNEHLSGTQTEVAFLDDCVYNEMFEFPDMKLKGTILNIDQMEVPHGKSATENSTTSGT